MGRVIVQDHQRYKLLQRYRTPVYSRGELVYCHLRKCHVEVGGYTDALIPWPRAKKTGRASLILCDDLVKAVQTESEIAIAHWWDVGLVTVWKWRKALNVHPVTPGTEKLYQGYYHEKLPEKATALGREHAALPENVEKMKSTKRGKPAHPATRQALKEAATRPKTDEWKKQHSQRMAQQWADGIRSNPDEWTPEEREILSAHPGLTARELIELLPGRTINAIRGKRQQLSADKARRKAKWKRRLKLLSGIRR